MSCKARLSDLAIFGGTPAFAEPAHVGRPNLACQTPFRRRLDQLLERRWLTNDGPLVREFEQRVAELLGVRDCVAMSSGTTAIEIAARATCLRGEVIVPSMTFVATVHALRWSGLTPVFCDIDPATHNLDPCRVEELIGPRTSAILGVHLWGRACAVDALAGIAARHELTLLYDAAHAFACSHRGRLIGGFGAAEAFSFHATKFIHTFEGGAVTTDDEALAARLRSMRSHGLTSNGQLAELGINGRMSEVAAAMGLSLLEQLDVLIDANRRNYVAYQTELRDAPGVRLLSQDPPEAGNYQYIVIEVDPELAGIRRDQLMRILHAENVLAKRYYYPGCHRLDPYRSLHLQTARSLPVTERLLERVLCLPTGETIDSRAVAVIGAIIRLAIAGAGETQRRLRVLEAA